MPINSVRLRNFKGFREVHLALRPLTLLLGPNSAGKSSFGHALVALSRIHERGTEPSLDLGTPSTIDLGTYNDILHAGSKIGDPIAIGVGTGSGEVVFGFGGSYEAAPYTGIRSLDLTLLEVAKTQPEDVSSIASAPPGATTSVSMEGVPALEHGIFGRIAETYRRQNASTWRRGDNQEFTLLFSGLELRAAAHLSGTAIEVSDILPLKDVANLVDKIAYLRPDRLGPERLYTPPNSDQDPEIGDRGENIAWVVHAKRNQPVDTYFYPSPTSDRVEATRKAESLRRYRGARMSLSRALSLWLERLGMAESLSTRLENRRMAELGVRMEAVLQKGAASRSLTDMGFGLSQVLPVLARGLTLDQDGLLIVEQPEAQLHPRPQAELADFFCSMIKCKRHVLVETHSEALFHRLRLRVAMDPSLEDQVAVYFVDAPQSVNAGEIVCASPGRVSLREEDELKWPKGFLNEGFESEMQIRAARLAKR